MALKIRRIDYFYTTVRDQPGEGYHLFSQLADLGVDLLAVTAVPIGPEHTQLTMFPEDRQMMVAAAKNAGLTLDGPHSALLVQGDDRLGALASVHAKLYEENVNVYASSGVSAGGGRYGYILYVRPEEYEKAARALGV
jgi:predicted amino acid-binding ACT domain protein